MGKVVSHLNSISSSLCLDGQRRLAVLIALSALVDSFPPGVFIPELVEEDDYHT
jgi:hypothetical protein